MRGTIHHIDLTVSDLMVSAAFYETVLGFLGYRRTSTRPDYVDWNLPGCPCSKICWAREAGNRRWVLYQSDRDTGSTAA
jgi:catechol 2,3-dioxygenase-like lactoylglutathione lyase family enzyme